MVIPIECHDCHAVAAVNYVTAGTRCACGSTDLDVHDPARVAAQGFLEYMGATASSGGTGWGKPMPDPLEGWNAYAGPMPGPNPFANDDRVARCPVCLGSGEDIRDNRNNGACRECGGSGQLTPTTSVAPEPQVARHNYPSTQTSVPFVGQRRSAASVEEHIRSTTPGYTDRGYTDTKADTHSPLVKIREPYDYSDEALKNRRETQPYAMDEANCPNCGHAPTHLTPDYKEDAWWTCPNCGPLANVDRHPEIDPYHPPEDFTPSPRSFRTSKRWPLGSDKKTGRVLKMLASVHTANPGLTVPEVLQVVRATVTKYAE